ncbi:MAG TPA: polymer-forming cytoskeletal protein [Anaerolineales bacterium]
MFRRRDPSTPSIAQPVPTERVTSVLGNGISWKGNLSGSGGVRIEGAFEGDITLRGLLVVGESGRVTCESLKANVVIVAGIVRGDITAEKIEIRATGRVWGNVVAAAFATEEGAFLRGQVRMEERVELNEPVAAPAPVEPAPERPAPEPAPPLMDTPPSENGGSAPE